MLRFFASYLFWHYGKAYKELFHVLRNFIFFLYHFFSIKILLSTLFAPWHKLSENYKKGIDLGAFFESFVVNFIMRIVGFFVRIFVIVLGFLIITVSLVGSVITFIIWTFLPLIIIMLILTSIRLLTLEKFG